MARIRLDVEDLSLRLTLKVMLEADGHALTGQEHDVSIVDTAKEAVRSGKVGPTLLLCNAAGVAEAVKAMKLGVFGYVMLPLVPGEAAVMVQRALGAAAGNGEAAAVTFRLDDVERQHIEMVMRHCKHNQAEAARLLGIGRNTLWRKLKDWA